MNPKARKKSATKVSVARPACPKHRGAGLCHCPVEPGALPVKECAWCALRREEHIQTCKVIDRLRARERKLVAQMEKTAKRFDAMKFDEFAAELRAALEKP